MVGSRQVTLSVYRQLDWVDWAYVEPFGRVNDYRDQNDVGECCYVVGRDTRTGALVRSFVDKMRLVIELHDTPGFDTWINAHHWPTSQKKPETVVIYSDDEDIVCLQIPVLIVELCDQHGRAEYRRRIWGDGSGGDDPNAVEVELQQKARRYLAEVRGRRNFEQVDCYRHWSELPLIVLAGLR
jgi:hypothetical protein